MYIIKDGALLRTVHTNIDTSYNSLHDVFLRAQMTPSRLIDRGVRFDWPKLWNVEPRLTRLGQYE